MADTYLLDAHGEPIDLAQRNGKVKTGERGFTAEGVTYFQPPNEIWDVFAPDDPTIEDYREMYKKDTEVFSLRESVVQALLSADWQIEPVEGGEKEAEALETAFTRSAGEGGMKTPLDTVIANMLSAMYQMPARAHFEIDWQIATGIPGVAYVPEKVALRPVTTCHLLADPQGNIEGFRQRGMSGNKWVDEYFYVEPGPPARKDGGEGYKAFVYVHNAHRNPLEGETPFRVIYEKYRLKKSVEWLMMNSLAVQAFARYFLQHDGTEAGMKNMLKRFMNTKGGGAFGGGPNDKVTEISTLGATDEFRNVANYLNAEMARSLFMQWQLLGTDSNVGSWALSTNHRDFAVMLFASLLKQVANALREGLFSLFIELNFGDTSKTPNIVFGELSETDILWAKELYETAIQYAQYGSGVVNRALLERMEDLLMQGLGGDQDKLDEARKEQQNQPQAQIANPQEIKQIQALVQRHDARQAAGQDIADQNVAPQQPNGQPVAQGG